MTASTESGNVELLIKLFDEVEKEAVSIEKLERSGYYSEYDTERLYYLILKSLRNFYAESEINFQIKDEVLNLRCLVDKAQYRQCRKMLTSLKRELYETEQFSFLLKVFDIEKKLVVFEEGKRIRLKPSLIANEEQSVINKEMRLIQYHKLFIEISNDAKQMNDKMEQHLKNPLLVDFMEALSMKERVFVLKCKEKIFENLKKTEETEGCKKNVNEMFQKYMFLRDYFVDINIC
jgi:hypothetical protein